MPAVLERRYGRGRHHFVRFSCYHRNEHFSTPGSRLLFERCLETIRARYDFTLDVYVVMPEHVHLLVSEPAQHTLSVVMQALKVSVARKMTPGPFRERRFYDFSVFTEQKHVAKRQYIHCNPFTRGLVEHPKDWIGSSYRHWAYGEKAIVSIASTWTYAE